MLGLAISGCASSLAGCSTGWSLGLGKVAVCSQCNPEFICLVWFLMTSIDVKKTLSPRKRPKGSGALRVAKLAGFYIRAAGEMITGQMVWYVMFPRRMALRHTAYGKPEASATLRSLRWL